MGENNEGSKKQEMTITRVFDAPREQLWQAWTEPEHFAHWFGTPPFTTPLSTIRMDVKPGGEWRATMVHESDGTELPFLGEYLEVEKPERLVMTFKNPDDPNDPNVEVLTVTFTDQGGNTKVVCHQAGHMVPDEYLRVKEGYTGFLNRLAEHLQVINKED